MVHLVISSATIPYWRPPDAFAIMQDRPHLPSLYGEHLKIFEPSKRGGQAPVRHAGQVCSAVEASNMMWSVARQWGLSVRDSGRVPLCIGSSIIMSRSDFLGVDAVAGIIGSYSYSYWRWVLGQRSPQVTETYDTCVGQVGGHVARRCRGWRIEVQTWNVCLECWEWERGVS